MAYKDPVKNREYQRDQMRRRRAAQKLLDKENSSLGCGIVGSVLVSKMNRTQEIVFRPNHIIILNRYAKQNNLSLSDAVGDYIQKGLAHDAMLEMRQSQSSD